MQRNTVFRIVLSVVVAGVLVAHSNAQAAAPKHSLRLVPVQVKRIATLYAVYKQAEDGRTLDMASLQRMGNVMEDYGAFVTLEASSRQMAELKRQAFRVERYELGKLKKLQGVPVELARATSRAALEPLGRPAGFYIVQFTSFPKEEWFAALALDGAKKDPSGFFSDFGHLYWLDDGQALRILQRDFVNAVVPFYPRLKGPLTPNGTPLAQSMSTHTKWQILVPSWVDLSSVKRRLEGLGLEVSEPMKHVGDRSIFVGEGANTAAIAAADLPEVGWVEPLLTAQPMLKVARKLHQKGSGAACTGTLDEVPVWAGGITAAGVAPSCSPAPGTEQLIGVIDTTFFSPDLSCPGVPSCSILKYSSYRPPDCNILNFQTSCIPGNSHGTGVAGILVGNASQEGGPIPIEACRRKGHAFGGRLWAVACGDNLDCFNSCHLGSEQVVINEFFQNSYADGSRLSNHSWATFTTFYNLESEAVDFWAYDNTGNPTGGLTQKYLWFFAAGNSGPDLGTVLQPAGAKDDLTGAAVYNGVNGSCYFGDSPPCDESKIVVYSSRGPTPDGRHGPDLAGASQFVSTPDNGSGFQDFNGTSAGTPNLTALGALVRDWLIQRYSIPDPNAALVKALLLNSGDYIPNAGFGPEDLPGTSQGWGRPNLSNLCDNWSAAGCQSTNSLGTEGVFTMSGTQFGVLSAEVTDSSKPLRCMLAWMDRPNLAGGGALVNDLDLMVRAPDATCYRGNNFSGAWSLPGCASGFDTVNVDEGVRIQSPATGVWYVDVIASNIAAGPQQFSVVCSGGIRVPLGALAITGVGVQDVCPSGGPGDANGIIEPGETITLPVTLKNQGTQNISQISGVLSSTSAGVTVTRDGGTWPDLASGASAQSNPNHFQFQVGNTVSCGTRLNFNLNLTTSAGAMQLPLPLPVGGTRRSEILSESFSGGIPPTWTVLHHGTGTGDAATWTAQNPCGRVIPPPFMAPWATGDSACAGPSASLDEELITPVINASSCTQTTLEFTNQFICSGGTCIGGGLIGPGQQGDVDISTNGGTSWTHVMQFQSATDGYPSPLTKSVDITSTIQPNPANVRIRFHYYNATNAAWWAIDNVKVRCVAPICNVCNP